jgi:HEAT repeat protein
MAEPATHQEKEDVRASDATVNQLVEQLADRDGLQRQDARKKLVDIGAPAVPRLIKVLRSPNERVRWEATKALGEIRDPLAAPALVQTLEDDESAIRWLAASALIVLGRDSLRPLLEALERHSDAMWMREGAHRVLHTLIRDGLADDAVPVLEALEDIEPAIEVPIAAYNVLHQIGQDSEMQAPES